MNNPARTCIGCRGRAHRDELWRLVRVDGRLVVDLARTAPGRGASIHPDLSCWELAVRRRAVARALRVDGIAEDLVWAAADQVGLVRRVGLGGPERTA